MKWSNIFKRKKKELYGESVDSKQEEEKQSEMSSNLSSVIDQDFAIIGNAFATQEGFVNNGNNMSVSLAKPKSEAREKEDDQGDSSSQSSEMGEKGQL